VSKKTLTEEYIAVAREIALRRLEHGIIPHDGAVSYTTSLPRMKQRRYEPNTLPEDYCDAHREEALKRFEAGQIELQPMRMATKPSSRSKP
jgi:hypothetical protein